MNQKDLLQWYVTAGVSETIAETPINRFQNKQSPVATAFMPPTDSHSFAVPAQVVIPEKSSITTQADLTLLEQADQLASSCQSLSELQAKLPSFTACSLSKTANESFVAQGQVQKPLVCCIIDAPRADADKEKDLFAGEIGIRLKKMLSAIHLDSTNCCVLPLIPWRLPGDRAPRDTEIQISLTFLKKQLELIQPSFLLCLGNVVTQALFDMSLLKARQQELVYQTSFGAISARATFSSDMLQKTNSNSSREKAWLDLQNFEKFVKENKNN